MTKTLKIRHFETLKTVKNGVTIEKLVERPLLIEVKEIVKTANSDLGFTPWIVDIIHFDGKARPTDLYYIACNAYFRSLRFWYSRGDLGQVYDMYTHAFNGKRDITKEYIQTAVWKIWQGYTYEKDGPKKGAHLQGLAEGETSYRNLARIAYAVINAMASDKGVIGDKLGRETSTDFGDLNRKFDLAIFDFIDSNKVDFNLDRYDEFMDNIAKFLKPLPSYTRIFRTLWNGNYCQCLDRHNRGNFDLQQLAIDSGYSVGTCKRAIKAIRQAASDTLTFYQFNTYNDLKQYLIG